MEKILAFLKKYKKKIIVLVVVLILFIICFIICKQLLAYLNPNTKESVYGDRCELTESIMITDERNDAVKTAVESYENMKLSNVNVKCNLIDILITVDNSVDEQKVKEMSSKILEAFSKEELKYYDLEIMVNWPDDPDKAMMGTHHKMVNGEMNDQFVWS